MLSLRHRLGQKRQSAGIIEDRDKRRGERRFELNQISSRTGRGGGQSSGGGSQKHTIVVDPIRGGDATVQTQHRHRLNVHSDHSGVDDFGRTPRHMSDYDASLSSSDDGSAVADDSDELDSQSSAFLEKEMPRFPHQAPACFCNGGSFCKKHQSKAISAVGLLNLLQKQFKEVRKDEDMHNTELSRIDKGVKEVFVSRQDVS